MPTVFTNPQVKLYKGEGSCRAFASVKVADAVVLTGLRVIEGKNGLFVAMASRKTRNDEYEDIYFPVSKALRDDLSKCVLDAYREAAGVPADERRKPSTSDEDLPF